MYNKTTTTIRFVCESKDDLKHYNTFEIYMEALKKSNEFMKKLNSIKSGILMCSLNSSMKERIKNVYVFAFIKHFRQVDKAGKPYIEHLESVALGYSLDYREILVGLLHDMMEDCEVVDEDIEYLKSIGVDDEVLKALYLLNKNTLIFDNNKNEDHYSQYIDRLIKSKNNLAICVKIKDLKSNLNLSRLEGAKITQGLFESNKKYIRALAIIISNYPQFCNAYIY